MDAAQMTNAQINKAMEAQKAVGSRIVSELIAAGRGHEKSQDIVRGGDRLSVAYREHIDACDVLNLEAKLRGFHNAFSLPTHGSWRTYRRERS